MGRPLTIRPYTRAMARAMFEKLGSGARMMTRLTWSAFCDSHERRVQFAAWVIREDRLDQLACCWDAK